MSIYGKVARVPSSPFLFDKIYSSRAEMEEACPNDGVYVGRYVLVSYGIRYDEAESEENPKTEVDNSTIDSVDGTKLILDRREKTVQIYKEKEEYAANREKDENQYGGFYDKTVWMKTYASGNEEDITQKEKYILIAELNAKVPDIKENLISPIVLDENGVESFNQPSFESLKSHEQAFTLNMPKLLEIILKNENLKLRLDNYPTNNEERISNYNNFNVDWKNILKSDDSNEVVGKELHIDLRAVGQALIDLEDALYGKPTLDSDGNIQSRPGEAYKDKLEELIGALPEGIIGFLANLADGELQKEDGDNGIYFNSVWTAPQGTFGHIVDKPIIYGTASEVNKLIADKYIEWDAFMEKQMSDIHFGEDVIYWQDTTQ